MVDIHKFSGRLGNELFRDSFIYSQVRRGKIPDVYLQDYRYFDEFKEEIKTRYGEGIGFLPFVSIHVRRAANPINPNEPKYSENPFYTNLSETDYYERAIALFPGKNFLVFSDDTKWCKEKFKGENFQVIEGGTELEDLNMMASCSEGNIIANSSFSFWGAYLNPSPSAKIVAPKDWYADKIERTILPPEWLRI